VKKPWEKSNCFAIAKLFLLRKKALGKIASRKLFLALQRWLNAAWKKLAIQSISFPLFPAAIVQ
jgi:hypothetical protein